MLILFISKFNSKEKESIQSNFDEMRDLQRQETSNSSSDSEATGSVLSPPSSPEETFDFRTTIN